MGEFLFKEFFNFRRVEKNMLRSWILQEVLAIGKVNVTSTEKAKARAGLKRVFPVRNLPFCLWLNLAGG